MQRFDVTVFLRRRRLNREPAQNAYLSESGFGVLL